MKASEQSRNLPSLNRISIISATILLAYSLARFINLPVQDLEIQLPGFYFSFQLNTRTFVTLLTAGLTAAGADWLVHDHPSLGKHRTVEHWLLPAFTAWVIAIPLYQLPLGFLWWVGFLLGGTILMLVLVAEYITVNSSDASHPIAAAGLTVVSYALLLILIVGLRYSALRLFLILPAIMLATWLIGLRTLHLRFEGRWYPMQAGIAALISAQLVAAFHYWPLSPVAFGLCILGATYGLVSTFAGLLEGETLKRAIVEPIILLVTFWLAASWIG